MRPGLSLFFTYRYLAQHLITADTGSTTVVDYQHDLLLIIDYLDRDLFKVREFFPSEANPKSHPHACIHDHEYIPSGHISTLTHSQLETLFVKKILEFSTGKDFGAL